MPVHEHRKKFFEGIGSVGISGGSGGETWVDADDDGIGEPGKLTTIGGTEVFIQPLTESMPQKLGRDGVGIVVQPENNSEDTVPEAIRIEGDHIVFGEKSRISNGDNPPDVAESEVRKEVGASSDSRVLVMRTDTVEYPDWSVY